MPHKILHVIGRMDRGGVETWLMHVLRNIDRREFEFHFLVQTDVQCAYDMEIRSLGGKIHYAGNPRNPLLYAARFRDIILRNGPFRAVHSHVYFCSGFVVKLAFHFGIPVRIAQSHTARTTPRRTTRLLYEKLMRRWLLRYATHRIGVSKSAGEALFNAPFTVASYGIDFAPFRRGNSQTESDQLKERYGIARGLKVIGHIGRFVPEKNHHFLVQAFEELLKAGVDAHLLLVGAGPLLPVIQQRIESLGLTDRCTFAGVQSDVACFLNIMDLLLLPSEWEGLGIVGLEAQAAGVPVLASTGVPADVDVIPELVEHLPLERGPAYWACAVRRSLEQRRARLGDEFMRLESSKFGLNSTLSALCRRYTEPPPISQFAFSNEKTTCDAEHVPL
jgi:glycosyltransferase involved in cell wall biosynthesis